MGLGRNEACIPYHHFLLRDVRRSSVCSHNRKAVASMSRTIAHLTIVATDGRATSTVRDTVRI